MYAAEPDPYCYKGTTVLKNKAGLRDQFKLDQFELAMTTQRAHEPIPLGKFDLDHFRALHQHLFQDVYRWAGRFRTVRITKGENTFCYPENIDPELTKLFEALANSEYFRGLGADDFARLAAHFLAEVNAIHAFREGNGRVQNLFFEVLANRAGHPLDMRRLHPDAFLDATIRSFAGEEAPLAQQIRDLIDD